MNKNKYLPLSFIFQHKDMLSAMGKIGLKNFKLIHPQKYPSWEEIPAINKIISAPSNTLVEAYIQWCGASNARYENTLPPHMFSQWGLAMATELALLTSYNLLNVINQGVSMHIYGDLPRNQELLLSANIDSIKEQDGIARLTVKITTGTIQEPQLVDAFVHMAFLLPNFKKIINNKKTSELGWEAQGEWRSTKHDGFKFALLTGDFNPIHWINLVGKMSTFKMKVLHGFGMFVRTYERLPTSIETLNVRFLKPIALPSSILNVEIRKGELDINEFRLRGRDNVVHLFGTFQKCVEYY